MTMTATDTVPEVDERPVEEVRCSETGVPLPTIPNWYATVDVKFVSNAVKKNTYVAGLPGSDDAVAVVADTDSDTEPALDEIEIDDIELEDDAEAEVEEE